MTCALCERVLLMKADTYPNLVYEFKHSFLMLGDHQYFAGYCVLVLKDHYREMTDLPQALQAEFFAEMMLTHRLIEQTFRPKKMNMCSLGNVVDHIHWHFFPRYEDDPHFKTPPWLQMAHFDDARLSMEEAREVIEKLKNNLKNLLSSVS